MQITHVGAGMRRETKTVTFTGAANLGAQGPVPLFTVTGRVLLAVVAPYCTGDLVSAGGGTLALGVTGSTALLIAATTGTDIDVGEWWVDTTPDSAGVAVPAALKDIAISANVIATVAVGDITGGTIVFDVWWLPLSSDGNLVA